MNAARDLSVLYAVRACQLDLNTVELKKNVNTLGSGRVFSVYG